jgi:hypothetical protein
VDEASAITAEDIEGQLGGYPEKKKDYPQRALEALHVALDDYKQKVSSGAIPNYAAMPAPERTPEQPVKAEEPAPQQTEDGKLLIKLR